jgi:hypothetical protein
MKFHTLPDIQLEAVHAAEVTDEILPGIHGEVGTLEAENADVVSKFGMFPVPHEFRRVPGIVAEDSTGRPSSYED